MTDQQTSIPVANKEAPTTENGEGKQPDKPQKAPAGGGVKAIINEVTKDAKIISTEVKKLPEKRKTLFYAGVGLILSTIIGALSGNFYISVIFGLFVPVAYGMLIVLSGYTGKDILDEIQKTKQAKKAPKTPHAGHVEIHEEDKIHEVK